jgi:hypothetical protein
MESSRDVVSPPLLSISLIGPCVRISKIPGNVATAPFDRTFVHPTINAYFSFDHASMAESRPPEKV